MLTRNVKKTGSAQTRCSRTRRLPSAVVLLMAGLSVVSQPALAQSADDSGLFMSTQNPFAENLGNQAVNSEFTVEGEQSFGSSAEGNGPLDDNAPNSMSAPVDQFATPDYMTNPEALYDPNADINVNSEDSFARSLEQGPAFLRPEAKSATREGPRNGNMVANPDAERPDDDVLLAGGMQLAKQRVLNYPCVSGGTIERCMQLKALMPDFGDKGWQIRSDGTNLQGRLQYIVQRTLLMSGTLPLVYSWRVDELGRVEPLTIRAELITELPL